MITPIKLYNTMTRRVEEFKPLTPGHVGMYLCGPTVYHYAHIGNLRTVIHNDIMRRMFLANGYNVNQVMNLTDVGHLTSDADTGEDKMEKGAAREGKSVWDIAQFYTDEFLRDVADLNVLPATTMPRATEYIAQQIKQVQALEKLGYTYEIPGDGIYYDTSKFANYGALTGGAVDGNRAGARVAFNDAKRNPNDFALWKFSPTDGAKRQMEWDSPWGVGFPGWSIECSAMSMELLGPHFDIHAGGEDLSRIHHANEIAQSEPIVGAPWVNYWVHFAFLMDKSGDKKLAKSSGEFLSLDAIRKRGYDPIVYRYLILLGHFQSQIAFSWEALDAAANGYKNIVKKIATIIPTAIGGGCDEVAGGGWHDKILSAVNDNLKTATAIVEFQNMLADADTDPATKIAIVKFVDELLGLEFMAHAENMIDKTIRKNIPNEVQNLVDRRVEAKANKNWELADELRDKLAKLGWIVEDTPTGSRLISLV